MPADLRVCLETCLSEEASTATLERHLPQIRDIIVRLLQGLKTKQAYYKQLQMEQQQPRLPPNVHGSRVPTPGARSASRSESATGASSPRPSATAQVPPRPMPDLRQATGSPRAFSPPPHARPQPPLPSHQQQQSQSQPQPQPQPQPHPHPQSQLYSQAQPAMSSHAPSSVPKPAPAMTAAQPWAHDRPPLPKPATASKASPAITASPPVSLSPPVPPPAPATASESVTLPPPISGAAIPVTPQSSLRMPTEQEKNEEINLRLRNSDTLERRASKRFSAYTFNKIGAGLLSSIGSTPTSMYTYGDRRTPQSALSSVKEGRDGREVKEALQNVTPTRQNRMSKNLTEESLTSLRSGDVKQAGDKDAQAARESDAASIYSEEQPLVVFLQVGRQTRKVTLPVDDTQPDRGLNLAMLRMQFVDQFSYSSGKLDFPEIYIKDHATGVPYQLEDMSDIEPRSLLMLNIEPLDQVKEHVDLSIASLSRELTELKTLLRENTMTRDAPRHTPMLAESTPIPDTEFKKAGDRMSTQIMTTTPTLQNGTDYAADLKTHYEALQKLRNDFAILRQIQDEGERDMRHLMTSVREQAKEMSRVVAIGPSAGRNLIESGKAHLDAQSQQVLTNVEDLQDLIEDLKLDVSHRGVKPKATELRRVTNDMNTAQQRLTELEQYIQSVRPHWKKTWENELQFIVDEQEFLNYQEGLLTDLKQDLTAVQDVFGHIQQIVRLRDVGQARGDDPGRAPTRYVPPPPDAEHEGLPSVMIEVRGQSIDHERRLRALQAAERSREKAKAGRSDEFADELAGFVDNKALRRTGGHLEAERVRQKRDQTTLRAMFDGSGEAQMGSKE